MKARMVESISQINTNQWDNLVRQATRGSIFHTTDWLAAIEDGLSRETKHVLVEIDGNPIAVCPHVVTKVDVPENTPNRFEKYVPRRLHSIEPGVGGPLIVSKEEAALDSLFDAIAEICNGEFLAHSLRLGDSWTIRYAQYLRQRGYTPSLMNCRRWIDLRKDIDEIWNDMDKERRKDIRNAKEHDPRIETTLLDEGNVIDFYREYIKTMKRVGGDRFPLSFFRSLAEHFDDEIVVFTAYVDKTVIGKHVCFRDDLRDTVHYFFNGMSEKYFEYSPSPLLHDYAIRWSIEKGYETYDFGSTSSNFKNGIFRFKSKFGGKVEPIYVWERGHTRVMWPIYDWVRTRYRRHTSVLDE